MTPPSQLYLQNYHARGRLPAFFIFLQKSCVAEPLFRKNRASSPPPRKYPLNTNESSKRETEEQRAQALCRGSPGSSMTAHTSAPAPEEANRARGLSQRTEIRSPDTSASAPPAPPSPSTAQPARLTAPSPALRRALADGAGNQVAEPKTTEEPPGCPGACRFPWSHCDPSCHRQPPPRILCF